MISLNSYNKNLILNYVYSLLHALSIENMFNFYKDNVEHNLCFMYNVVGNSYFMLHRLGYKTYCNPMYNFNFIKFSDTDKDLHNVEFESLLDSHDGVVFIHNHPCPISINASQGDLGYAIAKINSLKYLNKNMYFMMINQSSQLILYAIYEPNVGFQVSGEGLFIKFVDMFHKHSARKLFGKFFEYKDWKRCNLICINLKEYHLEHLKIMDCPIECIGNDTICTKDVRFANIDDAVYYLKSCTHVYVVAEIHNLVIVRAYCPNNSIN